MTSDQHTGRVEERGLTEPEGYAASLRQQARWIREALDNSVPAEQRIGLEDIDCDELEAAADYIESRPAQRSVSIPANVYHYRVIFKPSVIAPDFDVK